MLSKYEAEVMGAQFLRLGKYAIRTILECEYDKIVPFANGEKGDTFFHPKYGHVPAISKPFMQYGSMRISVHVHTGNDGYVRTAVLDMDELAYGADE